MKYSLENFDVKDKNHTFNLIIVFSKLCAMTVPVKSHQQYKICMHSVQVPSKHHHK